MTEIITQTERLTLRVPRVEDVDVLAPYWCDAETMRYIGHSGEGWSRETVQQRIEAAIERQRVSGYCFWVVELRETGEVIGQGGIVPVANQGPEIELGYRLGKMHWGKGYATEIAGASAKHALENLGIERLIAVTYPENVASRHVLTKVGFEDRGITDRYYDITCALYELTRARWDALRASHSGG
jgi:RimJ/RimL family protein N-acetyltransferase